LTTQNTDSSTSETKYDVAESIFDTIVAIKPERVLGFVDLYNDVVGPDNVVQ